jgi:hypothetical protein
MERGKEFTKTPNPDLWSGLVYIALSELKIIVGFSGS